MRNLTCLKTFVQENKEVLSMIPAIKVAFGWCGMTLARVR
jgi:hypothetical protein